MAVAPGHGLAGIVQRFQVHGTVHTVEPHGSGLINSSLRVLCQGAQQSHAYLLQRMNTAVFKEPAALMNNVERVTAHLAAKLAGQPDAERRVLTLIPAVAGGSFHQEPDGSCWRMFRFLEHAVTYDRVQSAWQAQQAAFAFGRFQQQLADLPAPELHETIPGFHDTPQRFHAFQSALQQDAANRAAACAAEIDFLLAREPLAVALLRAGLPQRVTHNDTKLNNVLFDTASGEPLCVVDLDTVMPGLGLYDFGDMVRTATSPTDEDEQDLGRVGMQLPLFEALLRGYADGAGSILTPAEREHLSLAGPVLTYEQSLRFLGDHLSGDVYYRAARPGHNLDRCRTQIALLQSMERQADAIWRLTDEVVRGGPV